MRRLSKIISFAAAVVLSGVALALPSAAPAHASATEFILYNAETFGDGGYFLYAHAHNQPVGVSNLTSERQLWTFNYRSDECLLGSGCQLSTAWEIQLVGTTECLNFVPGNGAGQGDVFLDSCQPGDLNELFWQVQIGGQYGGPPTYYLRNVLGSYLLGNEYSYLTDTGVPAFGYGGPVDERGPGAGYFAQWIHT